MRHLITLRSLTLTSLLTAAMALPFGTARAQILDVAAGDSHSVALYGDGTVVTWGGQQFPNVPALPAGVTYVEIDAGGSTDEGYPISYELSLARRSDGVVVAWGNNAALDVPPLPPGLTYVEIAAGNAHALARRSDGSVVAWGADTSGQLDVPALPPGLTYVEISAGGWVEEEYDWTFFGTYTTWHHGHSVARRSDGSVVVWGDGSHGQKNVPALPPGVTFVEIAAGADHTVGLLSDGSLSAWGDNTFGQCDVTPPPPGLTYESVAAGAGHTTALLSDGSLVAWGNAPFAGDAPPLPAGMSWVTVDVGGLTDYSTDIYDFQPPSSGEYSYSHTLALRSDGSVVGWGNNAYGQTDQPPGPGSPWTDLGGGTVGVDGQPTLNGSGSLSAGSPAYITLSRAPSQAPMVAWISLAPTPFAALDGTVHAFPYTSQLLLTAGFFGSYTAITTWPAGFPPGTEIWFQFLVADPGSPHGITLSNGLLATTP